MKKIIFLGCENSHANQFIDYIRLGEKYTDVEVTGVYSDDNESALKLAEKYGLYTMKSYDEFVGKVDGVIVTARHGDSHYKFARPYLTNGIPVFIDKPITVSENDAVSFMRECKKYGVRVTGGSCLKHVDVVKKLKLEAEENAGGATLGGYVRTPVMLSSPYGGFFFYSQHLVETVGEIFGRYPESVFAVGAGKSINVLFRYMDYCVTGLFVDGNWTYYASRISEKGTNGGDFPVVTDSECFLAEFDEFYEILKGAPQRISYEDFIAPVFVLNAIKRSLVSGKEEKVRSFEL